MEQTSASGSWLIASTGSLSLVQFPGEYFSSASRVFQSLAQAHAHATRTNNLFLQDLRWSRAGLKGGGGLLRIVVNKLQVNQ